MSISNCQVTKFCNETVRPLAEKIRALRFLCIVAAEKWVEIQNLLPEQAEDIDDCRQSEGVSVLSSSDIKSFMLLVDSLITLFNTPSVSMVVNKPCVRTLEVTI